MKRVRLFVLLLALSSWGAGCVRLERPAIERASYILDVNRPAAEEDGRTLLQVRRLEIFSGFSGTGFVYRLGELNYTTDFYNRFLSSPSTLLTDEVRQWLAASGLFAAVSGQGSADFVLEGEVSALYGDFRDEPQAVLAIRFSLLDAGGARTRILFQQSYRKEIPLAGERPEALVNGWNMALAEILGELEKDLRQIYPLIAPKVGG